MPIDVRITVSDGLYFFLLSTEAARVCAGGTGCTIREAGPAAELFERMLRAGLNVENLAQGLVLPFSARN